MKNWIQESLLMLRGILTVVFGTRSDALVAADGKFFSGNQDETRKLVDMRLRALRRSLFFSLAILASAVIIAMALPINLAQPTRNMIGAMSIFCFAWATLAKLGWHVGSFAGNTVVERIDLLVFRFLYWLGTLLGTLALV